MRPPKSPRIQHKLALAQKRWPRLALSAKLAMLTVSGAPDSAEFRRALVDVMWHSDPRLIISFERNGSRWNADVGDEIGSQLFATGGYEQEEVAAVLTWIAKHRPVESLPVAVDVGANIGTTTVPLAKAGFHVIAIEPVGRTFALLNRNVEANGLDDTVETVQAAILETAGRVQMALGRGSGLSELVNSSNTYGFQWCGFEQDGGVESVDGRRLDSIVAEKGIDPAAVSFVWSDVQGAERGVIESATDLWTAGVPLWLEIWPFALERHGGLDKFVVAVCETFREFASRDEVLRSRDRTQLRPISEFEGWIRSIGNDNDTHSVYTDALLCP